MIKNFIYFMNGDYIERYIQFDDIIINKKSIKLFIKAASGAMLPLLTFKKTNLVYFRVDML